MSALPQKKSSIGVQKLDKTHISLVLSLWTYEQGEKQEALKGQFNMRFPLKTRLHIKLEAQWATPIIYKKKNMRVFNDPGIPKFERREATSQQGVTKNTEL